MSQNNRQESEQSEQGGSSAAKQRGTNWSEEEDLQLCTSWLEVSLDSRSGTDDKNDTYWERIKEHFDTHIQKEGSKHRSVGSLKSRWQTIKVAVAAYGESVSQAESDNTEGMSDADLKKKISEYFAKNSKGKKKFTMDSCYNLLKDKEKWIALTATDKAKNASKDTHRVVHHTDIAKDTHHVVQHPNVPTNTQRLPRHTEFDPLPSSSSASSSTSFSRPNGVNRVNQVAGEKRNRDEVIDMIGERMIELMDQVSYFMRERIMTVDPQTIVDPRRRSYILAKQEEFLDRWETEEEEKRTRQRQRLNNVVVAELPTPNAEDKENEEQDNGDHRAL